MRASIRTFFPFAFFRSRSITRKVTCADPAVSLTIELTSELTRSLSTFKKSLINQICPISINNKYFDFYNYISLALD